MLAEAVGLTAPMPGLAADGEPRRNDVARIPALARSDLRNAMRARALTTIFPGTTSGPRLGLGGAAIGNLFQPIGDGDATAVIRAALADGCRYFDTAPHYGNGLSERRFGDALRAVPAIGRMLSTKVGRILMPDPCAPRDQNGYVDVLPFVQRWDYSAIGVRRSVEDSLQRLGIARIDVAFIHDCDAMTHGSRHAAVLDQVVSEAVPDLERLVQEGYVRHFGLGVNDVDVCVQTLRRTAIDCLLLAGRYTLLDQSALPELLPLCVQRNVRVALGGVFNSGILATGVVRATQPIRFNYGAASGEWIARATALEEACSHFGVPLRAAALQFPLAHPAIDVVMSGAQTPLQWLDAMAMLNVAIPSEFWAYLKSEDLIPAAAPTPGDH
jgi:D-threo-aldose 1-dehydrogenase